MCSASSSNVRVVNDLSVAYTAPAQCEVEDRGATEARRPHGLLARRMVRCSGSSSGSGSRSRSGSRGERDASSSRLPTLASAADDSAKSGSARSRASAALAACRVSSAASIQAQPRDGRSKRMLTFLRTLTHRPVRPGAALDRASRPEAAFRLTGQALDFRCLARWPLALLALASRTIS